MHLELTNLLPPERLRMLRRDYFYRLTATALVFLAILLAIHGLLLIPSYGYLEQEIATRTERLAALEATLASADEQRLDARLNTLAAQTSALGSLATSTPQIDIASEVLAVAHPGVRITGFTLAPPRARASETMNITGTAATRDALRAYYLALQSSSFVGSANLPVSAYALEANLPFTITLTLP